MSQAVQDLAEAGVAVWLEHLSHPCLQSGSLAALVGEGAVVGITTNPTIFAKAIGVGSGCEAQVRDLALRGTAVGETLRLLTGSTPAGLMTVDELLKQASSGKPDGGGTG